MTGAKRNKFIVITCVLHNFLPLGAVLKGAIAILLLQYIITLEDREKYSNEGKHREAEIRNR